MNTTTDPSTHNVLDHTIPADVLGRYLTVSEVSRLRAAGVAIAKPTRVIRTAKGVDSIGDLYVPAGRRHANMGVRVSMQ